jgi:hypothetical protein
MLSKTVPCIVALIFALCTQPAFADDAEISSAVQKEKVIASAQDLLKNIKLRSDVVTGYRSTGFSKNEEYEKLRLELKQVLDQRNSWGESLNLPKMDFSTEEKRIAAQELQNSLKDFTTSRVDERLASEGLIDTLSPAGYSEARNAVDALILKRVRREIEDKMSSYKIELDKSLKDQVKQGSRKLVRDYVARLNIKQGGQLVINLDSENALSWSPAKLKAMSGKRDTMQNRMLKAAKRVEMRTAQVNALMPTSKRNEVEDTLERGRGAILSTKAVRIELNKAGAGSFKNYLDGTCAQLSSAMSSVKFRLLNDTPSGKADLKYTLVLLASMETDVNNVLKKYGIEPTIQLEEDASSVVVSSVGGNIAFYYDDQLVVTKQVLRSHGGVFEIRAVAKDDVQRKMATLGGGDIKWIAKNLAHYHYEEVDPESQAKRKDVEYSLKSEKYFWVPQQNTWEQSLNHIQWTNSNIKTQGSENNAIRLTVSAPGIPVRFSVRGQTSWDARVSEESAGDSRTVVDPPFCDGYIEFSFNKPKK